MATQLRVVGGQDREPARVPPDPEERLRVFKAMTASMMVDALGVWSKIYGEFEGTVTHGTMVRPEAREGFVPACGWPEFLEDLRLLEHYLDHLRRICEGRA